jgi:hypothetical protein
VSRRASCACGAALSRHRRELRADNAKPKHFALVVWREVRKPGVRQIRSSFSYFASHADAARAAPADAPFTVVDVARKPWINLPTVDDLVRRSRPLFEQRKSPLWTPGLRQAAKAAREHADACTEPSCHRTALALEAAVKSFENRALLAALTEPSTPETAPPPWWEVSREGEQEGPLRF